jgi:hypothetical protein
MKIQLNNTSRCILASALLVMAGTAFAQSDDDRELARAAVPDSTPRQLYDSAIREAGGAYKESLRDCNALRGVERSRCAREAKVTYDRDMGDAGALLRSDKS